MAKSKKASLMTKKKKEKEQESLNHIGPKWEWAEDGLREDSTNLEKVYIYEGRI